MSKQNRSSTTTLFGILPENDTWVRPYFSAYRKELFQALLLGVAMFAFAALLMFASGYLISRCAERPEGGIFVVLWPVAFVQIFGLGKPILRYFERLVSHDWVFRMTSDLRLRLYGALQSQAMRLKATHRIGDFLGLVAEDIGHLQNLYLRTIFPVVIGWLLLAGVAIFFGIFDALFGLAILVILLVVAVGLPLVSVRVNRTRIEREKACKNALYSDLTDNVLGSTDWVFSGRGESYIEQVKQAAEERHALASALSAYYRRGDLISLVFLTLGAVLVFVWAGQHFGGAGLPRADWIAAFVLGYFPLVEAFLPITQAATQANTYRDSAVRLNEYPRFSNEELGIEAAMLDTKSAVKFAIDDLMNQGDRSDVLTSSETVDAAASADAQATYPPTMSASGVAGVPSTEITPVSIEVCDLHFAHDSNHEVLSGINLTIAPGEKVAILGRSGSGKSTLASLIRGDLIPNTGSVLVDGTPAHAMEEAMPHTLGVVQQSAYLFNRTLRENLCIGNEDATDEEIWAALDAVELTTMVRALPASLDTMVDEAGTRFSGGERHRIALARVLLCHVGAILLDEPTVGLDPITESALLETLFKIAHDKTLVMITHHLQDIERFDRVIFIEDGKVEMDGSPVQLQETSERFRGLRQFDFGISVSSF